SIWRSSVASSRCATRPRVRSRVCERASRREAGIAEGLPLQVRLPGSPFHAVGLAPHRTRQRPGWWGAVRRETLLGMHSNTFAARAGRWSAKHRKKAIWGWLAFVAVAFVIGNVIGMKK